MNDISLKAYGEYAMAVYGTEVLKNRAIPSLSDGLKPVQRRIMWSMYQLGLKPSAKALKASRTIGEVMGKYHPHGDCLRGNTIVPLCNGERIAIQDLIGMEAQWVWSYDKETGKVVPAKAHSWRVGQNTKEIYRIKFTNGKKVECTFNHPFFDVETKKWIRAKDIVEGKILCGGSLTNDWYPILRLNNGFEKPLHQIAGEYSCGEYQSKDQVYHHVDEDTYNNEPGNLELVSRKKHATELHNDNLIGLKNGHKSMFSKKGKYREATKAKNQILAVEISKNYGLYIALKGLRFLEGMGKALTLKNYKKLVKLKLVYNLTRYETLLEKGIDWNDLLYYHFNGVPFDSSKATGLTKKFKRKRKNIVREHNNDSGQRQKAISNVLFRVKENVNSLNWNSYVEEAKSTASLNNTYANKKFLREHYGVTTFKKFLQKIHPENFFCVMSVEVVKLEATEPMYDFTVDGYENMLISLGENKYSGRYGPNEHNREVLLVAHNSSISSAMETLVNSPEPLIDGNGSNWGTVTDPAAADRYCEAKLTTYSFNTFFDNDYVAVTEQVLNYDDTRTEPVNLPAKTCNLLVNGTSGIAVGATCNIPAFEKDSVNALLKMFLNNKTKPTVAKVCSTLKFKTVYGGVFKETKDNLAALKQLVTTGKASIEFWPSYTLNKDRTVLTLTGFPASLRSGKALIKIAEHEAVASLLDETSIEDGIKFVLNAKRGTKFTDELIEKILKPVIIKEAYRVSYLMDFVNVVNEETLVETKFVSTSIIELIESWIVWRKNLETKVIDYRISQLEKSIERMKLFKLAHDKRDILDACRDDKDPKAFLIKKLKVTPEQADVLLGLTVRQLTRIYARDLLAEMKEANDKIKQYKADKKNVASLVVASLT